MKYHKIITVWERDPENKFKTLIEGKWATPELEYLKDCEWVFTEKIDGTNIRIMPHGIAGRTDKADIPPFLADNIIPIRRKMEIVGFDESTILYGEGYGNKIQKVGSKYIPDDTSFILFDVNIGGVWLKREDVEDIAYQLEIDVVPVVGNGSLEDAIKNVRAGFYSHVAQGELIAEGLIMRPFVGMKNRMGHRIITKIKHKDFVA